MLELGTPGAVRLLVILGVAAAGASLGIRTARQSRAEREAEAGTAAADELAVDGQAALAVEPEVTGSVGGSARS
jgi:hypothetical protein